MASIGDENNNVLLSICIPTYNRAKYLDETLKSITRQRVFVNSNKIEIVISDNFSSDDTSKLVHEYQERYPQKIIYSRNSENIFDKNFEKVLTLANGSFLKLNNDTLLHVEGTLDGMLNLIEENLKLKPLLYFSNGSLKVYKKLEGVGLDFFISNISINSTWIASFGIWKSTFEAISDFSQYSKFQLVQTDILFRIINSDTEIIFDDKIYFETQLPPKKGGYDIIEIFFDNYLFLLNRELSKNKISISVYRKELNKVLINFFCNWIALIKVFPDKYTFTYYNYKIKFKNNYNHIQYLIFLIKKNYLIIKYKLKKWLRLS